MKRKLFSLLVLLIMLAALVTPALAANLSFQVPKEVVVLTVNQDGTASIDYTYNFINDPGSLIDYVDVGVPNSDYDLSSVTADVNGAPLSDISASTYVNPGVAVGLGANSIQGGQTGTLHVKIGTVRSLFYQADTSKNNTAYASFQFSPNNFDSQYAHGTTDLTVTINLPPGIESSEPIYFNPTNWPGAAAPSTGVNDSGLAYYSWESSSANSSTQYIFGAAFPARLIPASTIQTKPLINIPWNQVFGFGFCGCIVLIVGLAIYGGIVSSKRRKLAYLPPKIAVEGLGIKRGLTAVEAAILMEQPMDKILTMILFSSVKKGAATVITKDPLKLDVVNPLPGGLETYERDFLTAFQKTETADRRDALQTMMVNLVNQLTEKMKGFSRKETVAYYNDIMTKAWQQVEAAQTPDVKMQAFDNQMDWTMLDKNFDNRTRNVFTSGPVILPMWWGRFDPVYRSSGPAMPAAGGSLIPSGNLTIPSANIPGADFAQSVVNSVQGFAGKVVGDVTSFTGGITDKTNPAPVAPPSSTTGRSGGFGGGGGGHCVCACACACAGCACACAGGGR